MDSQAEAAALHLIVPVFNEHENLPRLVEEVERHAPRPYRLLVVYDFEEDTTVPVARQLAESRPELVLVRNNLGRGPANAIRAGFAAVDSGPAVVVMADLSDDLSTLTPMLDSVSSSKSAAMLSATSRTLLKQCIQFRSISKRAASRSR